MIKRLLTLTTLMAVVGYVTPYLILGVCIFVLMRGQLVGVGKQSGVDGNGLGVHGEEDGRIDNH